MARSRPPLKGGWQFSAVQLAAWPAKSVKKCKFLFLRAALCSHGGGPRGKETLLAAEKDGALPEKVAPCDTTRASSYCGLAHRMTVASRVGKDTRGQLSGEMLSEWRIDTGATIRDKLHESC